MTLGRFNKVKVLISLIRTMCLWNILHKWNGFSPLVLRYIRFFLYASLITVIINRIIRWKPPSEQELPNVPGHLSSPPVFSGVRVARTVVFCFVFYRLLFDVRPFSFANCVVCPSNFFNQHIIILTSFRKRTEEINMRNTIKKNYNIRHYQIISLFIKLNVQNNRYISRQH